MITLDSLIYAFKCVGVILGIILCISFSINLLGELRLSHLKRVKQREQLEKFSLTDFFQQIDSFKDDGKDEK